MARRVLKIADDAIDSGSPATAAATGQPPVYFLLHVPKTAGQTVRMHLRTHCPPGTFVEPLRNGALPAGDEAAGRIRALCSHWLSSRMERRFAGRDIRRTVLLRDPVGQLVSLYNFRMSTYLDKGIGTYGFGLHLRALPRNFTANFLLTRWLGYDWLTATMMPETRQFDLIDAALRDFWFVGSQADCNRLIAMTAPDLGIPAKARADNVMASHREFNMFRTLRPDDLSDALRSSILSEHAVDQALWEKWCLDRQPSAELPRRPIALRCGDMATHALASASRIALRDFSRPGRVGQMQRIRRASTQREKGNWAEAARLYRRAIGRRPGTPQLWIDLATALLRLPRFDEAVEAFDRALALKPAMPTIVRWRDLAAQGIVPEDL